MNIEEKRSNILESESNQIRKILDYPTTVKVSRKIFIVLFIILINLFLLLDYLALIEEKNGILEIF